MKIEITHDKPFAGGRIFLGRIGEHERVWLATSEGISRHTDLQNLDDCLSSKLSFTRDAFLFRGDRAIAEINRLYNSGLSDEGTNFLTEIAHKIWEKSLSPQELKQFKLRAEKELIEEGFEKTADIDSMRGKEKRNAIKDILQSLNLGISEPYIREDDKVGRNDLCPCESGKKYKKCCGKK